MTVTPPSTYSKSAKKRSRNELDEEDHAVIDDELLMDTIAAKRQHISKMTPLRMKNDAELSTDKMKIQTPTMAVARASRRVEAYTHKPERMHEMSNELLVPPPVVVAQPVHNQVTTTPHKAKEIPKTISAVQNRLVEVPKQEATSNESPSKNGGLWILILVFLLAIVSGLWIFDRISSTLTIGALRQDLQNCRALQSHEKMQDEYYVKEMESQVRGWRQEVKAKNVELEALREECFKSRGSEK